MNFVRQEDGGVPCRNIRSEDFVSRCRIERARAYLGQGRGGWPEPWRHPDGSIRAQGAAQKSIFDVPERHRKTVIFRHRRTTIKN